MRRSLAILLALTLAPVAVSGRAQLPTRLLTEADLLHQGSFTIPDVMDVNSATAAAPQFCAYTNGQLAWHAANQSLFMACHDHSQTIGEFSVPAMGGVSTVLQTPRDAVNGLISAINPTDPNQKVIGGMWVSGSQMVVTVYSYYDGGGTATTSHFVRSTTLSSTAGFSGPYRVGTSGYPGAYAGFFAPVPSEWQASVGTSLLNGTGPHAIVGLWSWGPSIAVVNPAELLAATNPSSATRLLFYDQPHAPDPYCGPFGTQTPASDFFTGATEVMGVIFPANTRTMLFVGRHGMGPCEYEPGGGPQAPPYEPHVWAYDLNDLLLVKAGSSQPYQPMPYRTFRLPGLAGADIGGAAVDPATGRIFVSENYGDGVKPRIHVFRVAGALTPLPPRPGIIPNLRQQLGLLWTWLGLAPRA